MARKVLIPLDGSSESEEVIPLVKDELTDDDELLLIQVIPPGRTQTVGAHVILGSQVEEGDRAQARRYLQDVMRRESDGSGVWSSEVVVSNSVAEGITLAANQQSADLIAMYTHDRNLLGRMIKGSIAREVQRTASTEVRILGPRQISEPASADPDEVVTDGGAFAHLDIFRGMSAQHIQRVVSLGRRIQVAAGEKQGRGGEVAESLFLILSGEASLSAQSDIGEITVRIAGPGESFPLASMLESGTMITTAEAVTDLELLAILRADLMALCSREPEIGMRIYSNVAQIFANRYSATLTQLALSAEREMRG
jgi:nucleotide-binding universal stress UspA family protein